MSDLAVSAPFKSRKRSTSGSEQGFSASPRILEIQLPLKIASKQDLVAWSKYVMGLVASKVNFTSSGLKTHTLSAEKRVSLADNSVTKSKEMIKKAPFSEKRQGFNYPARRLKGPHMQRGDEKVMAYPLPLGETKIANPQDPFSLPSSNINGPTNFANSNVNFNANFENPFQQSEIDTFGNFDTLAQSPYFPKAFDNELGQTLPIAINDELTRNLSRLGEPLLSFPFQAVITINSQLPAATTILNTQPKDYFAFRPLSQFERDFEKNYTLTNESGQINVVFNDSGTNTNRKKTNEFARKEEKEEEAEEQEEQKKKSEKKAKSTKKQKSRKQQSSVLGDLLRMLGILRKPSKNTTEINVATPVLSILKGTNPQKIQVTFDEALPNQERRNETSNQAQELNVYNLDYCFIIIYAIYAICNIISQDDDDEEEEEEEEEEEGGSIQALIDLLPLAAPILEDLSDPNSDTDIAEVLQAAIPLLEGLSDPEEDGIDIPGVLLPLSQKLSEGPEGQGSDSGAILGPLIQLIAPLIGPLLGPLIGPLSRSSSGPTGKQGSASIISAAAGPLSQPQGPYGQSVLSNLVASITAKLSKELAASAGDSDVKSLVSSLVSGVLAGASAGSSGHKNYRHNTYGQKDTYYAPTTYGSYGTYDSYKPQEATNDISAILKEVLGAFLKLSATSSTSSANLSGTSSSGSAGLSASSSEGSSQPPKTPAYGPPTNPPYEAPPSMRPAYSPPASSPYETFTRRRAHQIKKF
ncbi:LOW QUALITY PROTEIN: uncharacterized protein LOC126849370 [Cataglyphis hispanica]|uniref:LOW QUALITY PROTEIN: uncharacterized protein LOC126849370 n=1 Tax=Cataglyphis hispanica TaxID=1086592 RepID=UPI00217F5E11|nr:LOW QUALITY PROTEIN: uncharacterized protein LOC126849370 [Cataglyphis hispanica]